MFKRSSPFQLFKQLAGLAREREREREKCLSHGVAMKIEGEMAKRFQVLATGFVTDGTGEQLSQSPLVSPYSFIDAIRINYFFFTLGKRDREDHVELSPSQK